MTIDNNLVCQECGFRFGDHRFNDMACPTQVNPHLYDYRNTVFAFKIEDQSVTIEELKVKRTALENKMCLLIKQFQEETQCNITSIDIIYEKRVPMFFVNDIIQISIEIKLP